MIEIIRNSSRKSFLSSSFVEKWNQNESELIRMINSSLFEGWLVESFSEKFIINANAWTRKGTLRRGQRTQVEGKVAFVFNWINFSFVCLISGSFSRLWGKHNHRLKRRVNETYPSHHRLRWSYSSRSILSPSPASHRFSSLSCFYLYILCL